MLQHRDSQLFSPLSTKSKGLTFALDQVSYSCSQSTRKQRGIITSNYPDVDEKFRVRFEGSLYWWGWI